MSKPIILKPQKARDFLGTDASWSVHQTEIPNFEARLTASIVERWALVAAWPDGEDSAGRQRLRLPTPKELATRAADIAAETYAQLAERGWMEEIPGPEEAAKAFDAAAEKK